MEQPITFLHIFAKNNLRKFMKRIFTTSLKYIVISVLTLLAIILICGEPTENEHWFITHIGMKAIGFACGGLMLLLYKKWENVFDEE